MNDIAADARNLQTWLLLPGAEARYPGANVMAAFLEILLTSCTPDTQELLENEIALIRTLICGNGKG